MNHENLDIYKCYKNSPYLSIKHSTYFHVYSQLFESYRGKAITFIEVGIYNGGSLFMWRDYFGPQARIIGVEFNPSAKKWEKDGFEIFIGNQSDPKFWQNLFEKIGSVDIVLDDGGHTNQQQIITSMQCLPNINDGGLLIIEDTHCSYMMKFGNPSRFSFIEWSKKIIDDINSRFNDLNIKSSKFKNYVHSIEYFDSIVCYKIDRSKCITGVSTNNEGVSSDAKDFRYKDSFISSIGMKSRYAYFIIMWLQNFSLRKYF